MPCNNLKGEMAKKNVTIEEIAECLNVHRNSVANKINGRSKFSISEAFKIQKNFFPELEVEYLFAIAE